MSKNVLIRCLGAVVLAPCVVCAAELFNPAPAPDDFALPLPEGQAMWFRPVFLDVGDAPFAGREFTLGDRSAGDYRMYPTKTVLGGSFIKPARGRFPKDWMYYLGKYELTEGQFDLIMGGARTTSDLPLRGVTYIDILRFVDAYNLWLFQNHRNSLPDADGQKGILRLATEAEWEFAARGGALVSEEVFERAFPYEDDLRRFEWYGHNESSRFAVKRIGTRAPNQLGLHDMLGNVREWTATPYKVEYYQGRAGGYVARGGDFRTPKSEISAARRMEIPQYREDFTPMSQDGLGVRLVISVPVHSSMALTQRMMEEWPQYVMVRPVPLPTSQQRLGQAARANVQLDDLKNAVEEVEAAANAMPGAANLMARLGKIKSSYQGIAALINKAELDSASSWARIAQSAIMRMADGDMKLRQFDKLLEVSSNVNFTNQLREKKAIHEENTRSAVEAARLAIQQLANLDAWAVAEGFEDVRKRLVARGDDLALGCFALFIEFFEKHRGNLYHFDTFRANLLEHYERRTRL